MAVVPIIQVSLWLSCPSFKLGYGRRVYHSS